MDMLFYYQTSPPSLRTENERAHNPTKDSPVTLHLFAPTFLLAVFLLSGVGFAQSEPVWDTLSTGCTRLIVGSNGNMGHQGIGRVNLDYWDFGDCDTVDSIPGETERYLSDASPIIIKKLASPDTVIASWSMFGDGPGSAYGFLPVNDQVPPIAVPLHTNTATYQKFESGQFITVDSELAIEMTWWAPTSGDSCNFIIQRMMVFPYAGTAQSGLTIGQAFDFDVPADTATYNKGGFDAGLGLVYQQGYEYKSVAGKECQKNDRRLAGAAMLIGYNNIEYIASGMCKYQVAPYGLFTALTSEDIQPSGGFVPRDLWLKMSASGPQSVPDNADLHSILTYRHNSDLAATDTLVFYTVITTIKNGYLGDLQSSVSKAKRWYRNNLAGPDPMCTCINTTGNVDGDSWDLVDISDLSVMVDYLFFGGWLHGYFEECDVNQDLSIDIGDLQKLIDFLFFGGMLPNCW